MKCLSGDIVHHAILPLIPFISTLCLLRNSTGSGNNIHWLSQHIIYMNMLAIYEAGVLGFAMQHITTVVT